MCTLVLCWVYESLITSNIYPVDMFYTFLLIICLSQSVAILIIHLHTKIHKPRLNQISSSSSSSCSGRIRFDSCSLYPQNEIGPSISSSVVLCVFVKTLRIPSKGRSGPTLNIFTHYLKKRHDFRKKLLNIKRVFWFSLDLLSQIFFILRRIQRDTGINILRSSCKVNVILVGF